MATPDTTDKIAKTAKAQGRFRLPDPPEREPDEMTSYDQLHKTGSSHHLTHHFGNPETTLVEADRWIVPHPGFGVARRRRPDLFIAFEVDPAAYAASNGYVVSEQGKPPDFVLEVASKSTAEVDLHEKREDYAALGIGEYWRFDETGEFHGARLAGERLVGGWWVEGLLVGGEYVAIDIEELPDGGLQGYSGALDLRLRWEVGKLAWYDPATGRHIATFEDERARANAAEAERDAEREARFAAERERADAEQARARAERASAQAERARAEGERARADSVEARVDDERARADSAEARVRELEERLRRQNS